MAGIDSDSKKIAAMEVTVTTLKKMLQLQQNDIRRLRSEILRMNRKVSEADSKASEALANSPRRR